MFTTLTSEQIEDLIHSQVVGRIGCHADDLTYVVPISYAYDGVCIYGRTFEGKKLNMLRKNPKVCFQVDNTRDLSNWQSAICWGEFEEIKEQAGRHLAIGLLQNRHIPLVHSQTMQLAQDSPFASDDDSIPGVLFRIRIQEKSGMAECSTEQYYYST